MADLFDYLDWRGDITFDVDPFNDVDNLVLAELAYTDFEGLIPAPGKGEGPTVEELTEQYFSIHTEEEILARESFTRKAPLLLRKLAVSKRYQGMRIFGYVNIISGNLEKEAEQMSAVCYALPDGTCYAAFRGTDNTIVGWKEDFNFAYMSATDGQIRAAAYLNFMFGSRMCDLRVGGHSKGGNFAVFAAVEADRNVREKITAIYTNDGPGFQEAFTLLPEYVELMPKMHSIVPEGSLFGMLLANPVEHLVVKSNQTGLWQHDALSWQVLGNHFVTAEEVSETSRIMEKTVESWISKLDVDQRREFIDAVFDSVMGSGFETLADLNSDRFKNYGEILKAVRSLPRERQGAISAALGALVKSGSEVLVKEVKKNILGEKKEETPESKEPEAADEPAGEDAGTGNNNQ